MGTFPLSDFSNNASTYLTEYRNEVAPKTTQRRLGTFRTFARWAKLEDTLDDYTAPTEARAVPHPLPEGMAGVRRMLAVAKDNKQRALVALCGMQGLRVAEALSVTEHSIDFKEGTLTVRGKGDKTRTMPLFASAVPTLACALVDVAGTSKPLVDYSDRGARKAITRLGEKADISRPVSSHDLRATFATAAYANSKDIRAVQELLGHGTAKTTETYTGVSMDSMRKAGEV